MEIKKDNLLNIFLVIFFIIFVTLLFLFLNLDRTLDKQVLYAQVIVLDSYGFALNNSSLNFGMIAPGGSSSKEVIIANNFDYPIKMEFIKKGNISDILFVSENNFILNESENKTVVFSVSVSENFSLGFLDGQVTIFTREV